VVVVVLGGTAGNVMVGAVVVAPSVTARAAVD
jgi:hypothetical protein